METSSRNVNLLPISEIEIDKKWMILNKNTK